VSDKQDGQSRSERPTPKKLLDSRKKGQVARSRELNTTVMMLAASVGLILFGSFMGNDLQKLLADSLRIDAHMLASNGYLIKHFAVVTTDALVILLPYFVFMVVAVFIGPLILGGWAFSAAAMQPKISRMSLVAGMKRMFGMQGFVEMIKSLGKFLTVGTVALLTLGILKERILSLGAMPVIEGLYSGMSLIGQLFMFLAASLIIVSFIDVPYQLVSHVNRLKMSIQEIRDESKLTTGNPELKVRIRSLQREVSQRRMLTDVAGADVVIINPTHYSVALKYEEHNAGAPIVVASGVDFMALRIREVAAGNQVTVFSAPPLARALYQHAEIGQELPAGLYHAVAQVLAYVYQVRDLSISDRYLVTRPDELEIPSEFEVEVEDGSLEGAGP